MAERYESENKLDFDAVAYQVMDSITAIEEASLPIDSPDMKDLLSRSPKSPNYEANRDREQRLTERMTSIMRGILDHSGVKDEMQLREFERHSAAFFLTRKGGQLLRELYKAAIRGRQAQVKKNLNEMYVTLASSFAEKFNAVYEAWKAKAEVDAERVRARQAATVAIIGEHDARTLGRKHGASAEAKKRWELKHDTSDDGKEDEWGREREVN
ncbi:hypothetical protein HOG48_02665 [Candidatus Peregrinibacteria bacterium]|nr:hypothetical protein [Candidatus Peregrinibacteria bacterium]